MNQDLNKLNSVKNIILKYYSIKEINQKIENEAQRVKKDVLLNNQYKYKINQIRQSLFDYSYSKGKKLTTKLLILTIFILIFLVAAILFFSAFVYNEFFTLDYNVVYERVDNALKSEKFFLIPFIHKAIEEGSIIFNLIPFLSIFVYIGDSLGAPYCYFIGHILLLNIAIIIIFSVWFRYQFIFCDTEYTAIIAPIIMGIINTIVAVVYAYLHLKSMGVSGIERYLIGIPILLIISLLASIFSLRMLVLVFFPVVLPTVLINLLVFLLPFFWMLFEENYTYSNKKDRKLEEFKKEIEMFEQKMKERERELIKYGEEKYKAIVAKKQYNPYIAELNKYPAYLRDLTTVNSLIWAIQNGYAYDIVSARNYWDRKKIEANYQKQLDIIRKQTEQAEYQARLAAKNSKYAYEAAMEAKAAAQYAESASEETLREIERLKNQEIRVTIRNY